MSNSLRSAYVCSIGALLLIMALTGCGGGNEKSGADVEPVTPVQLAKVTRVPIQRIVTADAVLYPIRQSSVTPKISAPVRRFLVNRGDRVQQGQVLAELENRDLVAAVSETKALYTQAQAQYRTTTQGTIPEDTTKAQADVDSARQALEAAKKVYENRVALVREGALAQKLADDAKVAMVQAESQFLTARRHLESLQSVSRAEQVRSAQSQMDAAQARYAAAEAQVAYTQIHSPISGTVSDRPVNPGEIANSGSALITIVDSSEMVARANVPVHDIAHLKVGDTANIQSPDGEVAGKVTVVSPAVDPSSTTVEVWVQANNAGGKLKAGVTAKVFILAETVNDALNIPASALLSSEEGGDIVMVVDSASVAHERKVETGIREGDKVQIVSGLQEGERVVTVGGVGLADKSKVEVQATGKQAEKNE
jgi:multidrug efflux pump subunit AcrA (membrane-fusion protein)